MLRLDGAIWEVSCRDQPCAPCWVGQDDLIGLFPAWFIWISFPNAEQWEGRWWAAGGLLVLGIGHLL